MVDPGEPEGPEVLTSASHGSYQNLNFLLDALPIRSEDQFRRAHSMVSRASPSCPVHEHPLLTSFGGEYF